MLVVWTTDYVNQSFWQNPIFHNKIHVDECRQRRTEYDQKITVVNIFVKLVHFLLIKIGWARVNLGQQINILNIFALKQDISSIIHLKQY